MGGVVVYRHAIWLFGYAGLRKTSENIGKFFGNRCELCLFVKYCVSKLLSRYLCVWAKNYHLLCLTLLRLFDFKRRRKNIITSHYRCAVNYIHYTLRYSHHSPVITKSKIVVTVGPRLSSRCFWTLSWMVGARFKYLEYFYLMICSRKPATTTRLSLWREEKSTSNTFRSEEELIINNNLNENMVLHRHPSRPTANAEAVATQIYSLYISSLLLV